MIAYLFVTDGFFIGWSLLDYSRVKDTANKERVCSAASFAVPVALKVWR